MVDPHVHNGIDSIQIEFKDIDSVRSKQAALTTKNVTAASGTDAAIIENNRTRIAELETALQNLGLLN